MSSLVISFKIVMPMFLLMLTGRLLYRVGLLSDTVTGALNRLVSSVFLPCMLFMNMYNSDLRTTFDPVLFWFSVGGVIVSFVIFMLAVPKLVKSNKKRGTIIHALFRGNTAIFGIPLAQGIVGPNGNIDDLTAVMSAMIIVYNILGVLVLELYSEKKSTFGSVIKGIVTSPMTIGGVLGLVLALAGWRLPDFVVSPINSLALVTTPVAFLSLGASFNFKGAGQNRRYIMPVTLARLIAMPLIWLGLGIGLFGFRGGAVAALIAVFATPTAVNTFPLAAAADVDSELAGQLVVFTTVTSILTLFGLIFLLKTIGVV